MATRKVTANKGVRSAVKKALALPTAKSNKSRKIGTASGRKATINVRAGKIGNRKVGKAAARRTVNVLANRNTMRGKFRGTGVGRGGGGGGGRGAGNARFTAGIGARAGGAKG